MDLYLKEMNSTNENDHNKMKKRKKKEKTTHNLDNCERDMNIINGEFVNRFENFF